MTLTASSCIDVDWSCIDATLFAALVPEQVIRAEGFAQMAIQLLTGRQVGGCPVTVRPCVSQGLERRTWSEASLTTGGTGPYIQDGKWYNSCSCAIDACSCSNLQRVKMLRPVTKVVSVKVDGAVLPPTAYAIRGESELVRLSGPSWPARQNMSLPDTEPGTMSVTYVKGILLDSVGRFCAGILAAEYLEACKPGGGECRLPSNVVSITRQGVSIEMGKALFPGNLTGIPEVDLWVASWNPFGVKAPARVYSPESIHALQGR